MNDANRLEDRGTAPAECRPMANDTTRLERPRYRNAGFLLAILLLLAIAPIAACSGTPEHRAYDIADRQAVWLDKYAADKRACARRGGVIVQERYRPRAIRVGGSAPEVGTLYYCRY